MRVLGVVVRLGVVVVLAGADLLGREVLDAARQLDAPRLELALVAEDDLLRLEHLLLEVVVGDVLLLEVGAVLGVVVLALGLDLGKALDGHDAPGRDELVLHL